MSGSKVIVDSDALIGLINEVDNLHVRCVKISAYLNDHAMSIVIPYPIVLEAATALAKDKTIKRPDLAHLLLKNYAAIEDNSWEMNGLPFFVAASYDPGTSKKNTPFDYYVLACAEKNNIKTVFSFDTFYRKKGLMLAEDLFQTSLS